MSAKQRRQRQRHNFLLTFFPRPYKNHNTIAINGYILLQFQKVDREWCVSIYPENHFNGSPKFVADIKNIGKPD